MLNIILMGPPGAGKGTQATRIEDEFHLPHISTGDMFREAIANGTELGKKAKAIIESGGLVPDEITIGLVKERLSQDDCANGYLLDGFPRTLPQAEALTKMGPEILRSATLVVDISVPDEELLKRISGRRVCPSCGASYNVHFLPPKEEGVCDRCGGKLIQRKDDNEESFALRLSNYHQQTAPLIEYYKNQGIYHGFLGTGTPDSLFEEIKTLLGGEPVIIIKSPREIDLMREAGRVVGLIWEKIPEIIVPGVSTLEINSEVERLLAENGATAAEKGYYGYPASVCVSVNEQILHGIPSKRVVLRDGDIVTLDLVALKNGYMADSARTYEVGICGERQKRMVAIAKQCFDNAISLLKPGVHLGDICHAIGETAKANGCSVPRDYTGHGIGTHMHEDPYIPCFGTAGTGPTMREGMTLAIEPMILEGKPEVRVLKDGWTVVAKDGKLTSHYENTVVVTKDGCEVLTYSEAEKKAQKEAVN